MEEFPISPEDFAALFELIQADRTSGLEAIGHPLFFLHGGQPGSGKTELNKLVNRQVEGNLLECNADTLRDYHPDVERILRERESDYPELTWPAADQWNQRLIDLGIDHGYNLLIETTLRNEGLALATLARMKQAGYSTHLHVLAVPYRWSWLGINLRFEAVKVRKGFARSVSENDHDSRFINLQENLPAIVGSGDLDRAAVYRRQLTVAPGASFALELVTEEKTKIVGVFQEILNNPMGDEERRHFQEGCGRVVRYMEGRNAPPEQIRIFSDKADRLAAE